MIGRDDVSICFLYVRMRYMYNGDGRSFRVFVSRNADTGNAERERERERERI